MLGAGPLPPALSAAGVQSAAPTPTGGSISLGEHSKKERGVIGHVFFLTSKSSYKGFRNAVRRARRVAAAKGRPLRVMFADEARFGRMNRPQPCWAPAGIRPEVASQLIREYIYLYGAVCPTDGMCAFLILPASDTECFQIFLNCLGRRFLRSQILLIVDGAGNHGSGELVLPDNITLDFLPPYSPEFNPQEHVWDEIRENVFKNYAAKSIDEVTDKLVQAALYIERNPNMVKSMTSFPYIINAL